MSGGRRRERAAAPSIEIPRRRDRELSPRRRASRSGCARMTGPLPPWPDRPALFLDFDGTLLELAPEPHLVRPSPELTALLPALRPATDDAVALVSGRRIEEIDRILAPHRFAARSEEHTSE